MKGRETLHGTRVRIQGGRLMPFFLLYDISLPSLEENLNAHPGVAF